MRPAERLIQVADIERQDAGLRNVGKALPTERSMPLATPAPINAVSAGSAPCRPPALRKITPLQLIVATYFMVAGGPYGLEDLVKNTGYFAAVVLLLLTPIIWSLPTALMVSELSTAIPAEGGYYAWVRRAMGPFWGFQEAWLSLVASIFDMAIYPTLFVLYLGGLFPSLGTGLPAIAMGAAMIAVCALWSLTGTRGVGGSSVLLCI